MAMITPRKFLLTCMWLALSCVTCRSAALAADGPQGEGRIKLACVGDSITRGVGAGARSYPAQLAELLGAKWEVGNFGESGRTMVNGKAAWTTTRQYPSALEFKADVVTIMLGTNDSKPPEWTPHKGSFADDARALIASFRKANADVKIYICLPPPAYPGKWGIDDETIRNEICPLLRDLAKETHATLIDTYAAAANRPECFPDTVHPNADGATLLARAIYAALTGSSAASTEGSPLKEAPGSKPPGAKE